MMEWLDFFLQAFVNAMAWCLAVVVTLGLVIVVVHCVLHLWLWWTGSFSPVWEPEE